MAKTTTQITDEELTAKLKESQLAPSEKETLEPLIPQMTDDEKQELLALIEESHEVNKTVESMKQNYAKELHALNEEYEKKMNKVVKEETAKAAKKLEAAEQAKDEKEEAKLEKEIENL